MLSSVTTLDLTSSHLHFTSFFPGLPHVDTTHLVLMNAFASVTVGNTWWFISDANP